MVVIWMFYYTKTPVLTLFPVSILFYDMFITLSIRSFKWYAV